MDAIGATARVTRITPTITTKISGDSDGKMTENELPTPKEETSCVAGASNHDVQNAMKDVNSDLRDSNRGEDMTVTGEMLDPEGEKRVDYTMTEEESDHESNRNDQNDAAILESGATTDVTEADKEEKPNNCAVQESGGGGEDDNFLMEAEVTNEEETNNYAGQESGEMATNEDDNLSVEAMIADREDKANIRAMQESVGVDTNEDDSLPMEAVEANKEEDHSNCAVLKERVGGDISEDDNFPSPKQTTKRLSTSSDSDGSCADISPLTKKRMIETTTATDDDKTYPDSTMDSIIRTHGDVETASINIKHSTSICPTYLESHTNPHSPLSRCSDETNQKQEHYLPTNNSPTKPKAKAVIDPSWSLNGGFASNRGKKSDVDLIAIVKALEYGWRRELVHRKPQSEDKPNKSAGADIYYHSPCGQKLRSMPNILGYLKAKGMQDLDQSNFSFARRILTDHPNETQRGAVESGQRSVGTNKLSSPKGSAATMQPPIPPFSLVSPPSKSDTVRDPKALWIGNHAGAEHLGYLGLVPNPFQKRFHEAKQKEEPTDINSVVSCPQNGEEIRGENVSNRQDSNISLMATSPSNPTASLPIADKRAFAICSDECSLLKSEKTDPSLPCDACRTLFHPNCVNFNPDSVISNKFICQRCSSKSMTTPKSSALSSHRRASAASAHIIEREGSTVILKINGRLVKVPHNALVQTESGPKVMMTKKLLKEVLETAKRQEVAGATKPKSNGNLVNDDKSAKELTSKRPGPKCSKARHAKPGPENKTKQAIANTDEPLNNVSLNSMPA